MISKFKARFFGLVFVFLVIGLLSWQSDISPVYEADEMAERDLPLEEVLVSLGEEKLNHHIAVLDPEKAKLGRELVETGRASRKRIKSKIISPYFVCTDCHNLGREFAKNSDQSPEGRLAYAMENKLPFLPASTFWGIYNRTDFYNGDYIKKYGDVILSAKKSLPDAIQVCAKYCSAGRDLKGWEVEAILHFFKANELKVSDLDLSDAQKENALLSNTLSSSEQEKLALEIKSAYTTGYSAHFDETMPREKRKYGVGGDLVKGKFLYDHACLSCHKDGRVTHLKLDNDKLSGRLFVQNMEGYSDKSLYQIIRYGTYTMAGRNQYMPRFTKEKMSDQQIEDLMAYSRKLAEK